MQLLMLFISATWLGASAGAMKNNDFEHGDWENVFVFLRA